MGLYTKNGLLNGYKKNNKERASLDYYATPPKEVYNILNVTKDIIDYSNINNILEPCCGGGHMIKGILKFQDENDFNFNINATDFVDRQCAINKNVIISTGLDFLSDEYPYSHSDMIIMNPPYSTIEPFLIRALEIADKYLIVLCRTQVLEGQGRYENIFKNCPPTYVYQYVDRIHCLKNGCETKNSSSAQAYSWLIWDKTKEAGDTILKWIRRID